MSILSTLLTPTFDNGDGGGEGPLVAVIAQLSCPICQDVPTQPYLLPHCGHTFCYSCIKHWFKCNPSCPICRSIIGDSKPVLNHTVKAIIDQFISYINIQKLATPTFQTWRREKDEEFEEDRANDFPWLKKIKEHWGRAVVDAEDGVPRCSACHWELIDGQCENCGRQVMGWQDRTDGDELDGEEDEEDDEDEEEDENLIDPSGYRRDNARMNYGSDIEDDDWDDYDNGMSDLRGRMVDDEADDDDENDDDVDDDEAGDMHEIPSRNRHAFQYDSDDGFVVEDDDEDEQEDGNPHKDDEGGTSDIEIVDESGFASGDDDIVAMGRANSDVLNISDNSDDSDAPSIVKKGRTITFSDDDDDDDDNEDDEELISTSKFRNKAVIDENSDDEPVQEDELPSKKEKHSHTHKHKHRHHKHKSHKKNRR